MFVSIYAAVSSKYADYLAHLGSDGKDTALYSFFARKSFFDLLIVGSMVDICLLRCKLLNNGFRAKRAEGLSTEEQEMIKDKSLSKARPWRPRLLLDLRSTLLGDATITPFRTDVHCTIVQYHVSSRRICSLRASSPLLLQA